MKNSKLFTATAVFSIAITATLSTMSITSAYRDNANFNQGTRAMTQITAEQRDAIHEALENEDYEAWLELIPENSKMTDFTEAEFLEYAEEQLAKIEEMETRREEMEETREALEEALENLDYEAWYEIMKENERNEELLEIIDEDNFATFAEIHNLRKKAQELAEELGIDELKGTGLEQGRQRGMGMGEGKGIKFGCGKNASETSDETTE